MSTPKTHHSSNNIKSVVVGDDNKLQGNNNMDSTELRKPQPIPFLELSYTAISALDQNSIDFENVLSVWTGLTKSSSYVRNGKRLENISWRVINRNLVNDGYNKKSKINANDFNTLINISSSRTLRQPFLDELQHNHKNNQIHNHNHHNHTHNNNSNPNVSTITPKRKKQAPLRLASQESLLNNNRKSSSTSLHKQQSSLSSSADHCHHHHHHNQSSNSHNNNTTKKSDTSPQSQQQFPKRPANPRQVSEISIQNVGTEITEEVSSSDDEDNTVDNDSKKKFTNHDFNNKIINKSDNILKKNENTFEIDANDELEFHQPEPKFVSELFRKSNSSLTIEDDVNEEDVKNLDAINQELQNEKPPMLRSNTSTSIVRGFSPSHISVSYLNVQDAQNKALKDGSKEKIPSLFSNKNGSSSLEEVEEEHPKVPSLFGTGNGGNSSSLFGNKLNNKDNKNDESLPPVSSLFGNKMNNKSVKEDEQLPTVSSLFANKSNDKKKDEALPTVSSLFGDKSHSNNYDDEKLPTVSSLFTNQKPKSNNTQEVSVPPVSSLLSGNNNNNNGRKPLKTYNSSSASPLSKEVTKIASSLVSKQAEAQSQSLPQQHHQSQSQLHHTSAKKHNLLNNLGMTSLHNVTSTNSAKDPNNMFFIESSPSPAESDIVGSIDNITLNDHFHQQQKNNTQQQQQVSSSKSRQQQQQHDEIRGDGITHPNHQSIQHSHDGIGKRDEENSTTIEKPIGSIHEQSNTSLFQHQNNLKNNQLIYSSDSYSDDSDWSSVSDDSDSGSEDAEYNRQRWKEESLKFSKKDENKKPQIKRSLLSGLFLNEMNTDANNGKNHHRGGGENVRKVSADNIKTPIMRSNTTGDVFSAGGSLKWSNNKNSQQQHVIESKSSLEVSSSFKNHRKASSVTPSETTFNASASVTSPPLQSRPTFERKTSTSSILSNHSYSSSSQQQQQQHQHQANFYGSSIDKKQPPQQQQSSLTRLMSKSALNLTSYFVNSRRPPSSHQNHQSNAPPTAATLLPTALATHMFLPNVHQRAKSKLSSVVEASSNSVESSQLTKNDVDDDNHDDGSSTEMGKTAKKSQQQQHVAVNRKPSLPTAIPVKSRTSSFVSVNESDNTNTRPTNILNNGGFTSNNNNNTSNNQVIPGEKLSPRLSRKLMLATELSESLRASMLWDRKLTNVKLNDGYDNNIKNLKSSSSSLNENKKKKKLKDTDVEIPDLDNSSISDIDEIDKKNNLINGGEESMERQEVGGVGVENEEWVDNDDELDYHAKGW